MRQTFHASAFLAFAVWASPACSQTLTEYPMPASASSPRKIALGPDGNLWFSAISSNAIGRITPGGVVTSFPLPGPCDPYMSCYVVPIAAGPDGAMWYTELYGGRGLGRVTMDGVVTEPFDVMSIGGLGSLTAHQGYLWAVGSDAVVRLSMTGQADRYPLQPLSLPYDICAGDDAVWFTEYHAYKIGRVTDDGRLTEFPILSLRPSPRGIVVGPDQGIWFTETGGNRIGRLDPASGRIEEYTVPTEGAQPDFIAAGPDGRMWFTEEKASQVASFDIVTHEFREYRLGSNDARPEGIAAGPDGRVWFCEPGKNSIGAITAEWLLADFSFSPSSGSAGRPIEFSDSSTGSPTSWYWSFSDGTTSTLRNPGHLFAAAGAYDVTLTVTNVWGSNSKTKTVTVAAAPSAPVIQSFVANPPAVDPGQPTTLSWSSTGGNSASIDRGVGIVAPTGSVVITPVLGVPYTLTVTGPGGTAQASVTVAQLSHPEPGRWVLPGVVYNDAWQSDLAIFNPASQAMTLSLAFLDSTSPVWDTDLLVWKTLELPAGTSRSWQNVLSSEFATPKGHWGAVLVRGDVAHVRPVFTTRTYTSLPIGGTIGLSVPSCAVSGGIRAGSGDSSTRLIGLKENAAAYTNLGLVNLATDTLVAEATFSDASGNPLGTPVIFSLGPYGVFQLAHVLSADPPAGAGYKPPADAFSAVVRVVSGTAVAPYATVIDSLSKDPIAVTPTAQAGAVYRMPGIVRVPGANGTLWRSDVVVQNASASARNINMTYVYREPPNATAAVRVTRRLGAGQILYLDDFVRQQLGLSESDSSAYSNAWLDFAPTVEADGSTNTDPILVIGKTYNDQPAGNVGLQVPGYTAADGASAAGTNHRLALAGLVSTAAYRTNLALFLVDPNVVSPQVAATVKILDANGVVIKEIPFALDSMTGFVQKNDAEIFANLPLGERAQMSVLVDGITGNAAIGGYATILDNVTGDGTFVMAVPTP